MTDDEPQRRIELLQEAITDISKEQLEAINSKLRFWYPAETAHVFRAEEDHSFCGRQIDLSAGEVLTQQSDDESSSLSLQIETICETCFTEVLCVYEQHGQTETDAEPQQQPTITTEITKTVTNPSNARDYRATVEISVTGQDEIALAKAREIAAVVHDMLDDEGT